MSMLCSWNVLHEQSRQTVSFILVCDELDKAGWVVLSAIKGIDRIGRPVSTNVILEDLSLEPRLIAIVSDTDITKEFPRASKFVV